MIIKRKTKYRSLFQCSIDPIFLTSADLLLVDVNESFLKLLDYTTIKGRRVALRNIFESEEDYNTFVKVLQGSGQVKNMEVSLLTKTGEKKSCLVHCIFISDATPAQGCYQGILHDLTERKRAERDSLSAERLSLTGRIVRTMAHELRNPLTNLNLALDQLRSELPSDNESINLYGNIIERNINRIEQLVEEMLNSSKSRELKLERVSLTEIINDTIGQATDRIILNQIEVLTDYENDLPSILVDKPKIQIALLNIIINAIEIMIPGEGVLIIKAFKGKGTITVSITDNGRGIPACDIDKIFDPFFTNKPSGMGLGLTSTKNILNSHDAHIEITSELNKGTTFFVHFKKSDRGISSTC